MCALADDDLEAYGCKGQVPFAGNRLNVVGQLHDACEPAAQHVDPTTCLLTSTRANQLASCLGCQCAVYEQDTHLRSHKRQPQL